jgi:hypothetical protein
MPESTIDPPVQDPPVPPTPTKPTAPPPEPPEPKPDDAQAASSLTFKQRLNAAGQSLMGRGTSAEIEQLRAEVSVLSVERDSLRAELTTAKVRLRQAITEQEAARKALTEAELAVTEFEKKVIDHSIDLVAEAHVPAGQLPIAGAVGESAPQTKEQVEKALEGKSFQEKREILRAWRERK